MAKTTLRLVVPTTENRTVGPRRPKNAELRTREYLTPDEAELLIEAAKNRGSLTYAVDGLYNCLVGLQLV